MNPLAGEVNPLAGDAKQRLAVAALGTLPFVSSLSCSFALDDSQTVLTHPAVQKFALSQLLVRDFWGYPWWAELGIGTWRPAVTATFALDWKLGRGSPLVFHATNLLLYFALLVAIDVLLERWLGLEKTLRACAVLGFAVLAIHADVVPSVTGRAEIIAMLAGVGMMLAALAPSRRGLVLLAGATTIALLAKESTYPFALFVAWLTFRRGRMRVAAAAACLAPLVCVLVYRVPRFHAGFDHRYGNPLYVMHGAARVAGVFEAFAAYLQHVFAPIDLLPDYSYAALVPSIGARALVGVVLVGALVVAFVRATPLREPIAGMVASYAVVSHVALLSPQFVADRNFFFPSFFVVAIAAVLAMRVERKRALALVAGVTIAVQATFAALGTRVWRSSATLSAYGLETAPSSALFRAMRADEALIRGDVTGAAWNHLVAAAIEQRLPAKIADDEFPLEWEALPYAQRFAALVARIGRPAAITARDQAVADMVAAHKLAPAQLLQRWNP